MGASKKYGYPQIINFCLGFSIHLAVYGNPIYLFYVEYGRSPIDKEFSRAS